jgi:hypothetical protein
MSLPEADLAGIAAWCDALELPLSTSFEAWTAGMPGALIRRRMAIFSLSAEPDLASGELAMGISAPRESMRLGLQHIVEQVMAPEDVWLVRWLLGRWPRGEVRTVLPVNEGVRVATIGLIAPLIPTRIALSASPLPFDRPTVELFKALHEATGQPGLLGCRLKLQDGAVSGLAGRWRLGAETLDELLSFCGLDEASRGMTRAVVSGLGGTRPVFERWFHPAPSPDITVELKRPLTQSALGLARHLWGEAHVRPIADALSTLGQERLAFVSACISQGEVKKLTFGAPLTGDAPKGSW